MKYIPKICIKEEEQPSFVYFKIPLIRNSHLVCKISYTILSLLVAKYH